MDNNLLTCMDCTRNTVFLLSNFGSTGKEICFPSTYALSRAFGLDFFSPAAGTLPGATCGEPWRFVGHCMLGSGFPPGSRAC